MHKQKLGHEALDDRRCRLIARRIREGYSRQPVDRDKMFEQLEREIKEMDLWPQLTSEQVRRIVQNHVDGIVSEEIAFVERDYYFKAQENKQRLKSRRRKA